MMNAKDIRLSSTQSVNILIIENTKVLVVKVFEFDGMWSSSLTDPSIEENQTTNQLIFQQEFWN